MDKKTKFNKKGYRQRPEVKERMKEYMKEYRQRPEVKEYMKEYHQRPEVKERVKEYSQRPEVKERMKEYHQRPEVKERMKEYYQRPEVKERMKERMKEYHQRPEVKEHMKERNQLSKLKEFYIFKKQNAERVSKQYGIVPIPLEGKIILLNEIIDNLDKIKEYTQNFEPKIKYETQKVMIKQLLEKEGILVSRRRKLSFSPPRVSEGDE